MHKTKAAVPSKVLWVRAGAFGDILQAIARARLFKRKFPNAKLTMLARPEFKVILEPQDCFEDNIYWDSRRKHLDFFKCLNEVRRRNFDHLVLSIMPVLLLLYLFFRAYLTVMDTTVLLKVFVMIKMYGNGLKSLE